MQEHTRATLMSSANPNWRTPPEIFDPLNREYHFNLDAAASDDNHLCPVYWTEADDALKQPWTGRVWLNPPYGRGIDRWYAKAVKETQQGNADVVVLLVPARTDTSYWHDYVMSYAARVRLVRGRIKFLDDGGQPVAPAPFPSAIIEFRRGWQYTPDFSGWSIPAPLALSA